MNRFTKITLATLLFIPLSLFAQTGAIQGNCDQGGVKALLSGMSSTNYLDGIIPSCTVTVYRSGTNTLANPLYSNASTTPLANPFTGTTPAGQWIFWASTAYCYDVVLSGGVSPNTYTAPRTITGLCPGQPSTAINPVGPPYNCKIDGTTDDTACWQAICAALQTSNGFVQMPPGTTKVTQQICTIAHPLKWIGSGRGQSIFSFTGGSAANSLFDIEATSNVEMGNFQITSATGTTTGLTNAFKVRYSSHINLHDLTLANIGYGVTVNPASPIYSENNYDLQERNILITGNGGGYGLVNGYNGFPTIGLHQSGIIDQNNLATNEISDFNCQFCDITNSTVDQNNQPLGTVANGYAYFYYATNTTHAVTCTGSGTLTCIIALSAGVTQLPVAPFFRVMIYGVTGGTGTLNSIFDAALVNSTTFSVIGAGNSSGADYTSALAFYPTTNNLIDNVHGRNTAGSCIYLQGSLNTTVTNWECENVSQEQLGGSLPTGCVAVAGGNPNGLVTSGVSIGPGTCDGSTQYGIDFADSADLTITGVVIRNAATAAIRSFPGSFGNTNFKISGTIVDGTPQCFTTANSGTNTGSVSMDCQNFTTAGFIPQTAGINFHDSNLTVSSYLPCIDDFLGNNFDNVKCFGGYDIFASSATSLVTGGGVFNTTAGTAHRAVLVDGAQHLTISGGFAISGANNGIFFANNGATQPTDVTIKSVHIAGITTAPLIWDQAPVSFTCTTNTTNQVTTSNAADFEIGMGIGDYFTGGNNDIPLNTTISNISGTCSSGCTLTISNAAIGSHAGEVCKLQQTMSSNIRLWDVDAQCATAATQGFLFYGMQSLDISRPSIAGCTTLGAIDLRGQSNLVSINNPQIVQSSGTAAVYMPGGIAGSASNVTVNNPQFSGTGTNSFYDHSIGTGNILNLFSGTLGGVAASITNTTTAISGPVGASLTPAATAASTCAEQTFTAIPGLQTTQSVSVTPPSAMSHVSIGGARISAARALTINFCGDGTGGTAPSGTYLITAR